MTPKEKAKELVDKFRVFKSNTLALKAVDEIINTFIDIDPKISYWQEVKQEIEKL